MKRIISLILSAVILVSTLLLSSCGGIFRLRTVFPEGYTGGFIKHIDDGSGIEFYWVETYDELVEAMNLFRSHGSTFAESAIFTYEGDLFDTKYCICLQRFGGRADYVKYGDNPFDRWAENVMITSYGFFEEVTIDEIVYSLVKEYDQLKFYPSDDFIKICSSNPKISLVDLDCRWSDEYHSGRVYKGEAHLFNLVRSKNEEEIDLSDDCVNAVLNSIELIGFNQ